MDDKIASRSCLDSDALDTAKQIYGGHARRAAAINQPTSAHVCLLRTFRTFDPLFGFP